MENVSITDLTSKLKLKKFYQNMINTAYTFLIKFAFLTFFSVSVINVFLTLKMNNCAID